MLWWLVGVFIDGVELSKFWGDDYPNIHYLQLRHGIGTHFAKPSFLLKSNDIRLKLKLPNDLATVSVSKTSTLYIYNVISNHIQTNNFHHFIATHFWLYLVIIVVNFYKTRNRVTFQQLLTKVPTSQPHDKLRRPAPICTYVYRFAYMYICMQE